MRAPQLLRMARQRRGMSARAVSAQAGLSASYVGKIENEECEPSLAVFARIACALELNPIELWTIVQLEAASHAD